MKKILLATTMLAGTTGFAAAEIALSGYAEIGIYSDSAGDVQFWQDVDVKFSMSGTTDGGLEFGAVVDLDENGISGASTDDWGTTVYVSGAFGKLTMGDTDGALDWAVQDSGSLTSIADDHTTHLFYFAANGFDGEGDNQVARYENTFGAFGFAISAEQEDDGAAGGADDIIGIGLKYTADLGGTAVNLGLGYQTGNGDNPVTGSADVNGDVVGLSVGAELAGGFSATLGYLDYSYDLAAETGWKHIGLGLTYTSGPLSVHANAGRFDPDAGVSDTTYGLAVNYDLGGGAVVMAGWGSDVDGATAGDQDQWSIGLGMSF